MSPIVLSMITSHTVLPMFVLGGLLLGLFIMDLALPLGVAAGIPYLLAILLTKDIPGQRVTVVAGVVCAGLTVAGYFLSPSGGEEWKVLVNRSLAVCAIWMTTFLTVHWKDHADQLRLRAENIQSIIDLVPHMIYVRDANGKILMANQQACENLSISQEQLLELRKTRNRKGRVEDQKHWQAETRAREELRSHWYEEVFTGEQGEERIFHTARAPFYSLHSPNECILTVSIDQTEQLKLQESVLLAEQVFDGSSDHIAILDLNYRYRRVNPAYEAVFGLSRQPIVGSSVADIFGKEVFQNVIKAKLDRCMNGQEVAYESWVTLENGERRLMAVTHAPLKTNQGVVDGVVVVARDITDCKMAERGRAQLEYAVEHAREGLSLHDNEGKIMYVNSAEAAIYGYERDELLGTTWETFCDQEEMARIKEEILPFLEDQGRWRGELIGRKKTGEKFPVEISLNLSKMDDEGSLGLLCTCRDITTQKQAEHILKQNEETFRRIFESIQDGYLLADVGGNIRRVNSAAAQLLGYEQEELVHVNLTRDIYVDPAIWEDLQARLLTEQKVTNYEILFKKKDKSIVVAECNIQLLTDPENEEILLEGFFRDRTAQQESARALRESEERLRESEKFTNTIFENIPNMVFVKDAKNLNFIRLNKTAENLLGLSREELIGKNDYDFFPKEEAHFFRMTDQKVLQTGMLLDVPEESIHTRNLGVRILHTKKIPLYDQAGCPQFLLGISEDITERKQSEEMLKKWATVFEHVEWGVAVSQGEMPYFEMVNPAYARMHGYAPEELAGKPMASVFTEASRVKMPDIIRRVHLQGHLSFEATHLRKDGTTFPSLVTVSAIKNEHGTLLYRVGSVIDISDRKRAEEALQSSQATLQSFFDSAPFMMGMVELVDEDIRHLSDNIATGKFFNAPVEKLEGQTSRELGVPQEVRRLWFDAYQEAQRLSQPVRFEYEHLRDDRTCWLSATVSYIESSQKGNPKFSYVVEDISERKRLEEERERYAEWLEAEMMRRSQRIQELEQRRMQVEKLAALAQVAAGVAHEINNPLASIAQSMNLLKQAIPPRHRHFHYTQKIDECIDRISHIVKQLYQLYRPAGQQEQVDLVELVTYTKSIMTTLAEKNGVTIVSRWSESPVYVQFPKTNLIQVLCNITQNAIEASADGQTVLIDMTTDERTVKISIHDDGVGISESQQANIFEPFFTTKHGHHTESGMGLGLAVSRSLIESVGGVIRFTSREGEGTTVEVEIPKNIT